MGWWESLTEFFTGEGIEAYDPYTDIYISPTPEPMPLEIFPSVPAAGYEYYDPAYGITEGPGTEPWYQSLWGALSTTGKELLKSPLLPTLLKKDTGGLQYQFPKLGITPAYDRQDAQLYTPYQRADTGSRPITVGAAPSGISPMILLIGAGAVIFLMMRRKK